METPQFEHLLEKVVVRLTKEVRSNPDYREPAAFEKRVLEVMKDLSSDLPLQPKETFDPKAFPDIIANSFGVEVKTTAKDRWSALGNSALEGMRDPAVTKIYVVFGKMGGVPEVRWRRYEECIRHLKVSHSPRFSIQMDEPCDLFAKMGIAYADFANLTPEEKMKYVRDWARGWLKEGQRLWWIEEEEESAIPLEVTVFTALDSDERTIIQAEAALLCPRIVAPGSDKKKYNDAALYALMHHGVLCANTRDMYTAGSAAGRGSKGKLYIQEALKRIQDDMRKAAQYLDDALFVEFWGESVPPDKRISRWLELADGYAKDWTPSLSLFPYRV